MKQVIVDDELRERLFGFSEDLEFRDASGRILAHLQRSTPWMDSDNWTPLTPEISSEELQRRKNAGEPTFTTEQVVSHLKSL